MVHGNANAGEGEVRVVLLAGDGKPIPGFSKEDCEPIRRDGLDLPIRWEKPASLKDFVGKK